jgi:hypothetical protein
MIAQMLLFIIVFSAIILMAWGLEEHQNNKNFQRFMKVGDKCRYSDGYQNFHVRIQKFTDEGVEIKNEYDEVLIVGRGSLYV